ncbi:MAG: WYL domain-containing protein [Gemmatimonadaceae bacterium]|nr:WYL domain-containing protein [Gemmatimonadaceae bacterium]
MGVDLELDERTRRYCIRSQESSLNTVEALATYSAARMLVHTGSGGNHYRDAMRKLARLVPEPAKTALMRQVDVLEQGDDDRSLELVAQAWFGGRVLRCDYLSANRDTPIRRDLEIHFFEVNRRNHEAYVIAFDRTSRKDVAVFKLMRMSNVKVLEETYEPPTDFDPAIFFGPSYGVLRGTEVWVEVRVYAKAARAFRERLEDGIVIEHVSDDGSLLARIRGTLDDAGRALELMPLLLTWGDQLEVLEPPSVRESIATTLRNAAAKYAAHDVDPGRSTPPIGARPPTSGDEVITVLRVSWSMNADARAYIAQLPTASLDEALAVALTFDADVPDRQSLVDAFTEAGARHTRPSSN